MTVDSVILDRSKYSRRPACGYAGPVVPEMVIGLRYLGLLETVIEFCRLS